MSGGAKTMNTYDYTYKVQKKKLTLSINKDLVTAAKKKRINLSAFLESKLEESLILKEECRERDSDPRLPDYESGALTN
jgi:hypothetical protein